MKLHSSRRASGFTLVELLVVIAIIAVLASAGFAAGNAAIQKARKMTALATATAIESAVNNFYTEYGSMPKSGSGTPTIETDSGEGVTLLTVLLGMEPESPPPLNARAVKLLSVKEGKKKGSRGVNGLLYETGGKSIIGLYDPWGGPFHVMLDLDYTEKLKPEPKGGGSKDLNGRRVAVWSDGADWESAKQKASDDVITW